MVIYGHSFFKNCFVCLLSFIENVVAVSVVSLLYLVYDHGIALLLCLLLNDVVSLRRSFVTTHTLFFSLGLKNRHGHWLCWMSTTKKKGLI